MSNIYSAAILSLVFTGAQALTGASVELTNTALFYAIVLTLWNVIDWASAKWGSKKVVTNEPR